MNLLEAAGALLLFERWIKIEVGSASNRTEAALPVTTRSSTEQAGLRQEHVRLELPTGGGKAMISTDDDGGAVEQMFIL